MDPIPIQPDTTSVVAIPPSGGSGNLTPPDPKSDRGIPTYVLVILSIVVVSLLFLFNFFLQKSRRQSIPIPISTTNNQRPSSSLPTIQATPTSTPLQGPGPYSCSLLGTCKNWDPQLQKENCTVTFADKDCLGQCSDSTKRCKF